MSKKIKCFEVRVKDAAPRCTLNVPEACEMAKELLRKNPETPVEIFILYTNGEEMLWRLFV